MAPTRRPPCDEVRDLRCPRTARVLSRHAVRPRRELGAQHELALESTRLETAMSDVGLSMAKFGILKTLAARNEPVTLTDLASCQRCVRSNITIQT